MCAFIYSLGIHEYMHIRKRRTTESLWVVVLASCTFHTSSSLLFSLFPSCHVPHDPPCLSSPSLSLSCSSSSFSVLFFFFHKEDQRKAKMSFLSHQRTLALLHFHAALGYYYHFRAMSYASPLLSSYFTRPPHLIFKLS